MSFVYAEKYNEILDIHCDTKIGLDSFAGASFSQDQINAIHKYGIVKITLICSEIGIAFAGNNIYLASKLFNQLYENRIITTRDVVNMAYNIHMNTKEDDIEFIVASCEDGNLSLYCIKKRQVYKDCPVAWIGSAVAHREFQRLRLENNKGNASERTSTAFLDIVQSCSDKMVGGFHISAGYNSTTKALSYRECKTFQTSKPQLVQPSKKVRFYMDPADGGFSFEQVPFSLEDLMLKIDQMDSAILYSRRLRMNDRDMRNPQLFSLMLPMLVRKDHNGSWIRV